MNKKTAWKNFENTGNIQAYLEMKQIEHIEYEQILGGNIVSNIEAELKQNNESE